MGTLGQRIREVRKELGMTQVQFAKAVGLKQATISDLEADNTKATAAIGKIATLANVNIRWLETGEGEKRPDGASISPKNRDEAVFDVLDVKASCGDTSAGNDRPEVIRRIVMSVVRAREIVGSANTDGRIQVINAEKDSMYPTIKPTDLLFVDTSKIDFDGEGIYIIWHYGELICKRLQRVASSLMVISDNKNYMPWNWDDREIDTRIVGKVLCALPLDFRYFSK